MTIYDILAILAWLIVVIRPLWVMFVVWIVSRGPHSPSDALKHKVIELKRGFPAWMAVAITLTYNWWTVYWTIASIYVLVYHGLISFP